MTIMKLLEVDVRFIKAEEVESLRIADMWWKHTGEPMNGKPLMDCLEQILRLCRDQGHCYPPILLARKKQMERGTWQPTIVRSPILATTKLSPTSGCSRCGGTGMILSRDGKSAIGCECGIWKHSGKLSGGCKQ